MTQEEAAKLRQLLNHADTANRNLAIELMKSLGEPAWDEIFGVSEDTPTNVPWSPELITYFASRPAQRDRLTALTIPAHLSEPWSSLFLFRQPGEEATRQAAAIQGLASILKASTQLTTVNISTVEVDPFYFAEQFLPETCSVEWTGSDEVFYLATCPDGPFVIVLAAAVRPHFSDGVLSGFLMYAVGADGGNDYREFMYSVSFDEEGDITAQVCDAWDEDQPQQTMGEAGLCDLQALSATLWRPMQSGDGEWPHPGDGLLQRMTADGHGDRLWHTPAFNTALFLNREFLDRFAISYNPPDDMGRARLLSQFRPTD